MATVMTQDPHGHTGNLKYKGDVGYYTDTDVGGYREQVVSVTDIISEGPIEGLAKGGKSIFVNDDNLLEDEDTGHSPNAQGASVTAGSSTLNVNGIPGNEFTYNATTQTHFKKRVAIHNSIVITSQSHSLAFNTSITPNPELVNSPGGQNRAYKVSYTAVGLNSLSIPTSIKDTPVSNIKDIDFSKLDTMNDGDGIAIITNEAGDRYTLGVVKNFTDTSIELRIPIATRDNKDWLKEKIKISISLIKIVDSVDTANSTVTTTTSVPVNIDWSQTALNPFGSGITFSNGFNNFGIRESNKNRSAGYQFRNGLIDQPPIVNLAGTGISSIPLAATPELNIGETQTIVATGTNAAEIDQVDLVFQYPAGIYMVNTRDGGKHNAGAGYVIEIQVSDGAGNFVSPNPPSDPNDLNSRPPHFIQTGLTVSEELKNNLSSTSTSVASFTEIGTGIFAHGGKHTSGTAFTHSIDVTPFQPFAGFKLLVTRITESANMTDLQTGRAHVWNDRMDGQNFLQLTFRSSATQDGGPKWQAVQQGGISQAFGVIREKLTHPYTSICNITFDSKAYAQTPKRSYDCFGLKVRIPSNYITREGYKSLTASDAPYFEGESEGSFPGPSRLYSGIFTGEMTETLHYTDNPAWVFYDILTNNRYGLGEYVRDTDIDVFSLYKIARFCDELVPDGKGGYEPRFRSNLYLTKATDAFKVLKDMATTFRGLLYWMDSKLTPIIDQKKPPIYTFNRSNVIAGKFDFSYTNSKARINQVVVQWNNPENNYELEPLFVEDRANIAKTGIITRSQATAFGCTSRGQAVRYGRWKLYTSINQTEVVTFASALNSAFIGPGDVVNIQDNHDYNFAYGGRLVSVQSTTSGSSSSTITFDRPIAENATLGAGSKIVLLLSEAQVLTTSSVTVNGSTTASGQPIFNWKTSDQKTVHIVSSLSSVSSDFENAPAGDLAFALDTEKSYLKGSSSWAITNPLYTLEQLSSDAYDSASIPIQLEYARENRTKEISFTGFAGDTSFTTFELTQSEVIAANAAKIWALKDSQESEASYKAYRILGVQEKEDGSYVFSATEHFDEKFDSIETNFVSEKPDPTFPLEDLSVAVPPPTDLRIHRSPKFERDGEEITLVWNRPSRTQGGPSIKGFQIVNTIPGYNEILTTSTNRYYFTEVPSNFYTFEVRTISESGRYSKPVSLSVDIDDYYGGGHPRQFGMIKGGSVSASSVILNSQADQRIFKFETDPVSFYSPAATNETSKTLTGYGNLDFLALTEPSGVSWFDDRTNLTKSKAFVFLKDYATTSPELRVVNFIRDPVMGIQYWYDQLIQNKKIANENIDPSPYAGTFDIWTSRAGTVTLQSNQSKVIGSGTQFTNDYSLTSVIKFSGNQAANVTYIQSDTVMYIDRGFTFKSGTTTGFTVDGTHATYTTTEPHGLVKNDFILLTGQSPSAFNSPSIKVRVEEIPKVSNGGIVETDKFKFKIANTETNISGYNGAGTFTTAITASSHFSDELAPDFTTDFLIGTINSSGSFRSFLTIDPDIVERKTAIVDSNVTFINYLGDQTQSTAFSAEGIVIDVTPIGFKESEVKVTGSGFNQTSNTADTGFVTAVDNRRSVQVHGNSAIAYSNGSDLLFNIEVRDPKDPDNTAKQATKTFIIRKVKDGAAGTQGRTVELNAEDYSVLYNPTAQHSGTADLNGGTNNGIVLTATARNFGANPLFKFTVDGTAGSFTTSNTFSLPVPGTRQGNSSTILVEVAETGTTQVLASDSSSIAYVDSGSDGFTIVQSNSTHSFSTANDGTLPGSTIPNSGTSFEVFIGGVVGTYKGKTSGGTYGLATGVTESDLVDGEWYIGTPSDTDTAMNAGDISGVSNNIVSISDAIVSNTSGLEDNESITWPIKLKIGGAVVTASQTQTLSKSKEGAKGADASETIEMFKTINSSTPPSDVPTVTFDFSNKSLTVDTANGYTETQTAVDVNSRFAYKISKRINPPTSGTTVTVNSGWSSPALVGTFASDGVSGRTVTLTPNKQVVAYDAAGALVNSSESITFQAVGRNTVGAANFQFKVDGNDSGSSSSTSTFTLLSLPTSGTTKVVSVELTEGSNNTVLATDSVTIFGIKDGADGQDSLQGFLTNSVHTCAANADGSNADLTGASGIFKVFKGTTEITQNAAVTFEVALQSGVTGATITDNGVYSVANGSFPSNSDNVGSVVYKATIGTGIDGVDTAQEIEATFSLSKSRKGESGTGATGARGPKTQTGYLYFETAQATAPATLSASNVTVDFDNPSNTRSSNPKYGVTPPAFEAGTGVKHFYYYYSAVEIDTNSDGTFDGVSIQLSDQLAGVGFSGLVTFTSNGNGIQAQGTSQGLSFGPQGTTQIDGGNITTGQVLAANIQSSEILVSDLKDGTSLNALVNALKGTEINGTPLVNATTGASQDISVAASGDSTDDQLTNGTLIEQGRIIVGTTGINFTSNTDSSVNSGSASVPEYRLFDAIVIDSIGQQNAIKIFDGAVERVRLGKLT